MWKQKSFSRKMDPETATEYTFLYTYNCCLVVTGASLVYRSSWNVMRSQCLRWLRVTEGYAPSTSLHLWQKMLLRAEPLSAVTHMPAGRCRKEPRGKTLQVWLAFVCKCGDGSAAQCTSRGGNRVLMISHNRISCSQMTLWTQTHVHRYFYYTHFWFQIFRWRRAADFCS